MTFGFLDTIELQRSANRKLWKLASSREALELQDFLILEEQVLEDDFEIDLPSFTIDTTHRGSSTAIAMDRSSRSSRASASPISDKLEQTVNGVDLKTEVTAYRARITELELELSKTKQIYSKCKREREDYERKQRKVFDEKESHFEFRMNELDQKSRDLELREKQFKKDKIQWEKHKKITESLPTKRERQEVEILTQKINDLTTQFKAKESRLQLTQDRLHKKIMDLEKRNRELLDEIRVLEQERAGVLEQSKKMQKSASVEFKAREVPSLKKAFSAMDLRSDVRTSISSSEARKSFLKAQPKIQPVKQPIKQPKNDAVKAELDKIQIQLGLKRCVREVTNQDESRSRIFQNGTNLTLFTNGNYKLEPLNGPQVLYYSNGDSKTV